MAETNSLNYYRSTIYSEETTPPEEKPDDEKGSADKRQSINHRQNGAKKGSVISIIFVAVVAAVFLGAVVYTYDKRNTVYNQVAAKNEELTLVEAENVRLQSELESRMSAKNVEDYAENELGMRKIDSSQIKYIRIQTDDVVDIPQQDEGILAKVRAFFDSCVEYFRG